MLKNVIVIDDSMAMCQFLEASLKNLGIASVTAFDNGPDAIDYVSANMAAVDGVLTDLEMPGMDGLGVMEQLGKMHYRGGLIIVSGMEERIIKLATDIALSLRLHLVGSVEKPINYNKLQQMLGRIILLKGAPPDEPKLIEQRDLTNHIYHNHLLPYYQPQVNLNTGEIHGFEVLCRIDAPNEPEIVSPDRFIPVAEQCGLINKLTEFLMLRALDEFKEIKQALPDVKHKLSINISPPQLYDDTLPDILSDSCDSREVDIQEIVIEVTERQIINERKQLINLNRLRLKGFGLALDDFGAGFTNIRQMKDLPFTEIKVDHGLIKHIANDRISQVILHALEHISSEFGMALVAEGIETIEDYAYMESCKNILAQGFLISRPKPLNEIIRWCHAWQKKQPGMQES